MKLFLPLLTILGLLGTHALAQDKPDTRPNRRFIATNGMSSWTQHLDLPTVGKITKSAEVETIGIPLFARGQGSYNTYRIPALAVTRHGTILAFCEGRKNSQSDTGDIDLLVKRSTDNGQTWSEQQVIWDDGDNVCGNPCVAEDRDTGTIWLLTTWNRGDDREGKIITKTSKDTRRVFVFHSTDEGRTWSRPNEITVDVKMTNWTWYATGPGSGIQIEHGPHKGRLVIPCDHVEADTKYGFSHIIYSDDHGKTWKLGGSTPEHGVNECEVVELAGGKLMLNMRNFRNSKSNRQVAVSEDGGLTWKEQHFDPLLIEPRCQAAIERFSWPSATQRSVILFSNPASKRSRVNLTVRASFDDGQSWPATRVLHPGPSAYSDLATLTNGLIACLYEGGTTNCYEAIRFASFPLNSLQVAGKTSQFPIVAIAQETNRGVIDAADGSEQFKTIQSAADSIPADKTNKSRSR